MTTKEDCDKLRKQDKWSTQIYLCNLADKGVKLTSNERTAIMYAAKYDTPFSEGFGESQRPVSVEEKAELELRHQLSELPPGTQIGLGQQTLPVATNNEEDLRNYIPIVMVGVCILVGGYLLMGHIGSA